MNRFRLDGRRALVTGAGRGIGRAVAEGLADAGAEVVLCAWSASEIEMVADEIRAAGGRAAALPLDVTDTGACREARAALPAFDVLVNNADTNRPKPLAEVTTSRRSWGSTCIRSLC